MTSALLLVLMTNLVGILADTVVTLQEICSDLKNSSEFRPLGEVIANLGKVVTASSRKANEIGHGSKTNESLLIPPRSATQKMKIFKVKFFNGENCELNARYRQDPGEIGSLCSGLTPDLCSQQIPYVLVNTVLECAIRCTSHPRCKSYNYQVRPNSIGHTHRCEMAPDKSYDINKDAKRALGYQYYINVT